MTTTTTHTHRQRGRGRETKIESKAEGTNKDLNMYEYALVLVVTAGIAFTQLQCNIFVHKISINFSWPFLLENGCATRTNFIYSRCPILTCLLNGSHLEPKESYKNILIMMMNQCIKFYTNIKLHSHMHI